MDDAYNHLQPCAGALLPPVYVLLAICNSRIERQFSDHLYLSGLPVQAVKADIIKLQCCNKHLCAGGRGRLQYRDNGIWLPLCFSGNPGIYSSILAVNTLTLHSVLPGSDITSLK